METTKINFTRVNNDINGNPRYVIHFLSILPDSISDNMNLSIVAKYCEAVKLANTIGGKKYRGKDFGGGIVFQSYNTNDLEKHILKIKNS